MRKIKVLVVEDSVVFRKLIIESLSNDPILEVIGAVGDPYQAKDAICLLRPDVMTLDVELPGMSGIEFLRKLLPQYPIPTVMVSALSNKVFDALEAGAVDFVHKPTGLSIEQAMIYLRKELGTKLKIASTSKVSGKNKRSQEILQLKTRVKDSDFVIAIGASTGGTEAILEVVRKFERKIPGIVIVQHMPAEFIQMYADRLNYHCQVNVKIATTGERVIPGQILIAPGNQQMRVINIANGYQVECRKGAKVSGHSPSVDVLFESVAKAAKNKAIGVLLTGMGKDGADGLLAMRKAGAHTIGQDEKSCVVYGMPKVAYEIGAVEIQADVALIAPKIVHLLDTMQKESRN